MLLASSPALIATTLVPDETTTVTCQEFPEHSYDIYVPPGYSESGAPLPIFFTHAPGGGGMINKMRDAARSRNFIVVGVMKSNNNTVWLSYAGYDYAIVRDIMRRVNYDPSACYRTGFSGGGWASYDLARVHRSHTTGIFSQEGWMGFSYYPFARYPAGLPIATSYGTDGSTVRGSLLRDQAYLGSMGCVCKGFEHPGGHTASPTATTEAVFDWLMAQKRVVPGDEAALAATQAASWQSMIDGGSSAAVYVDCIETLITQPGSYYAREAQLIADALMADFSALRQFDLSDLPEGDDAYDFFAYRAYAAAMAGDWEVYYSAVHSAAATTGHSETMSPFLESTVARFGKPPPFGDLCVRNANPSDVRQLQLEMLNLSDPHQSITAVEWEIEGQVYAGNSCMHTFSDLGIHPVEVRLTLDDGHTYTRDYRVRAGPNARSMRYLDESVALRYTFDELDPTTVHDSSGHGRDGLLNATRKPVWGVSGRALAFNSEDDFITTTYPGISGGRHRAISFWIKTTDTEGTLLQWGNPEGSVGAVYGLALQPSSDKSYLIAFASVPFTARWHQTISGARINLSDGQWHHVALYHQVNPPFVDRIGYCDLFIDGEYQNTYGLSAPTLNTDTSTHTLSIGRNAAGICDFRGEIDELVIFEQYNAWTDYTLSYELYDELGLTEQYGSDYLAWFDSYFSETTPIDPALDADPDGDGMTQLQEYAHGGSPTVHDSTSVGPVFSQNWVSGAADFTALYQKAASDVSYTPQFSFDLQNWTPFSGSETLVSGQQYAWSMNLTSHETAFMRLQVEMPTQAVGGSDDILAYEGFGKHMSGWRADWLGRSAPEGISLGLSFGELATEKGAAILDQSGNEGAIWLEAERELDMPLDITSTPIYLSFLLRVNDSTDGNWRGNLLELNPKSKDSQFYTRLGATGSNIAGASMYYVYNNRNYAGPASPATITPGEVTLHVARIEAVNGKARIHVWFYQGGTLPSVDPLVGDAHYVGYVEEDLAGGQLVEIGLSAYSTDGAIDEIRLGTTFRSVLGEAY